MWCGIEIFFFGDHWGECFGGNVVWLFKVQTNILPLIPKS